METAIRDPLVPGRLSPRRSVPASIARPEYVDRPAKVTVTFQNLDGEEMTVEGEGLLARAICHEIDHLEGVTILDRLTGINRALLKKKLKKVLATGDWEVMTG